MDIGTYVKQAIAALATAGVLSVGPGQALQKYQTPNTHTSNYSQSSGYGDRLVNWLERSGYGSNPLKSIFMSNLDDNSKYAFATAFYDSFGKKESKAHDPGDEMVYLVPHEQSDGSFNYVNKMTGKIEVMVNRMPNGLFSYYGPVKWITRLGGRGELSGIRDSMADGQFFNKD